MKFRPSRVQYPFCSAMIAANKGGSHYIAPREKAECAECGRAVTDERSDHMNVESPGNAVLLCLPCAQTYKELIAMEEVVGT